jgi:hypothetical protein
MRAHRLYLRYVLRHKWFVLVACVRLGIPWRGLWHDWTKFLPVEWFPYVRLFYGKGRTRESLGDYSADAVRDGDFEVAWNHHQKHNDHHWQYWVRVGDDGTLLCLPMFSAARREMLADWRGVGRALGDPDTQAWYLAHRDAMKLHPDTRAWLEQQLGVRTNGKGTDREHL